MKKNPIKNSGKLLIKLRFDSVDNVPVLAPPHKTNSICGRIKEVVKLLKSDFAEPLLTAYNFPLVPVLK